jgi:hypothetical protein
MRNHGGMESETVRRNVKKRAAFGGMYVWYTLAKGATSVAGQAGDSPVSSVSAKTAPHIFAAITTLHHQKDAQADSGINILPTGWRQAS